MIPTTLTAFTLLLSTFQFTPVVMGLKMMMQYDSVSKPESGTSAVWWEQLPANPTKVFSQNDEDGILEHIFDNIGTTNKKYVEFGTEDGSETNTRLLREKHGWSGLLMDVGYENPAIGLHKEWISPDNIVGLFHKYNVETEFDLLSVDVDSFDAHVLRSILKNGFKPRVLVVEVNDNFGDESFLSFPNHEVSRFSWDKLCGQTCTIQDENKKSVEMLCGAGTAAINHIAEEAGYKAIYLNKVNMFFIRGDIAPQRMQTSWDLSRVMAHSKQLHRKHATFPRQECDHLMKGLVDVRH